MTGKGSRGNASGKELAEPTPPFFLQLTAVGITACPTQLKNGLLYICLVFFSYGGQLDKVSCFLSIPNSLPSPLHSQCFGSDIPQ